MKGNKIINCLSSRNNIYDTTLSYLYKNGHKLINQNLKESIAIKNISNTINNEIACPFKDIVKI